MFASWTRLGHMLTSFLEEFVGRVDGVAERSGPNHFRFTSALGTVAWHRRRAEHGWETVIDETTGMNLLGLDETNRFVSLADEHDAVARRPLHPWEHGRPYAYDSLSQLFDDEKVPDRLLVPAAGFPLHGNLGNHGALTSVQSRGLFLGAGPGFRRQGWISDHGRLVDVAPTLLALLGAPRTAGNTSSGAVRHDARLRAQDGSELASVLDHGTGSAAHVVAVIFDGCNTNLVADAIDAGDVPTLASLIDRGTGLRHGIVSSFPTVTLPNHLTAFTGVHPGRHGVVNNEFEDQRGTAVNLLDFAQMLTISDHLSPAVETVHEAVHRWLGPDAFTSATYEYADRGASWSTFTEFREQRRPPRATAEQAAASSTEWVYTESSDYRFQSRIDESSLVSAIGQWAGPSITGHPLPTLQLVNLSLTDSSGHSYGPHGDETRAALVDSDRRLARLLDAISAAGALDETAIVVLSDHGMEQCDLGLLETSIADVSGPLTQLGLRDVGDVFLFPAR
jgi:phosphonoacetate hydrolase